MNQSILVYFWENVEFLSYYVDTHISWFDYGKFYWHDPNIATLNHMGLWFVSMFQIEVCN